VTSVSDGAGRKTNYTYDALGHPLTITPPSGGRNTLTYDKRGQVIGKTNPLGETQTIVRDGAGRMMQITLPGGLTSSIQLDAFGQPASITDPNGSKWTLGFDAVGRPAKFTDPLGNATAINYNGTQIAGETLPLGSAAYISDKDGRVTQRKYSDGTTINTGYDSAGLITSADGVTIKRDVKGYPITVNGLAITYTAAGRPATITYAAGKTIAYGYDNAGRLASVSDWVGGKTTFTYEASSRVNGMTYPNGVTTTYVYDADGLISKITAGSIGTITLVRDAAEKLISADRSFPTFTGFNATSQQFAYDAAGQLATSGTTNDKMGRVTTQTGRSYTWNLASQLTQFVDGANSATLTYDGLNEISSSAASGVQQDFVFNYVLPLPALSVVRQKGADLRYYVYTTTGTLLYSIEAADNTRRFYHFDEMGNTLALTSDNGQVTDTYAVTPYGELVSHGGTKDNPFTWQGQFGVMEEGRGLYYMRDRHYDAAAARFLSRDPIFTPDPRSAQPYAYARGNPLLYVDPMGDLSYSDLTHSADLIAATLWSVVTDQGFGVVHTTAVANSLKASVKAGECNAICEAEGWTFVSFVAAHEGIAWNQLNALLDVTPAPKPQAKLSSSVGGTALSPALKQSASAKGTCPNLGCYASAAAATLVANGSPFISHDGAGVVATDGASFISHDGAGVVSNDGGTLVSHDGGSVVSNDGGTLISQDGSGVIATDGASAVSPGGGK